MTANHTDWGDGKIVGAGFQYDDCLSAASTSATSAAFGVAGLRDVSFAYSRFLELSDEI